jgi:hypothetical protein
MAVHARQVHGRVLLGVVMFLVLALVAAIPATGAQVRSGGGGEGGPVDRVESSPQATPVDYADIGLVGPTSYQSPQFGFQITWDGTWDADPDSMESNPGIALDRLSIVSGTARFQVFYFAAEGETAAEYAARFMDFRLSGEPTMEVVTSGDRRGVVWIAYTFESRGQVASGIVEISLAGDGTALQVVELIDVPESFESAFSSSMSSIQVEGEAPFRVLTGWPD